MRMFFQNVIKTALAVSMLLRVCRLAKKIDKKWLVNIQLADT